ncbi:hypothetical protein Hmuk_2112 [Halomicrobium mukohataei DSM 12286]|uniref:DNA-directed RNA polymerase subunit P n=1 Tax=Halomicrobium mukohataei (strain ATCC 700874 / DSM 12286 / JCM 9738 / NCIMB 13541) TaxID=485914 RepID=C7NWL5_HALMD|nr:hypothetical protein Hmuk_2112 [Halomicrobium mukohataei DSM 12286]
MAKLSEGRVATYRCRTCGVRFSIPQRETAVCCPVCRMNRIKRVTD